MGFSKRSLILIADGEQDHARRLTESMDAMGPRRIRRMVQYSTGRKPLFPPMLNNPLCLLICARVAHGAFKWLTGLLEEKEMAGTFRKKEGVLIPELGHKTNPLIRLVSFRACDLLGSPC